MISLTDWPCHLDPMVATVLENTGAAMLIYGSDLRILHATNKLAHLVKLDREKLAADSRFGGLNSTAEADLKQPLSFVVGLDFADLLQGFTSIGEKAVLRLRALLERATQAGGTDNHSTVTNEIIVDGTTSLSVEIWQIGPKCWQASFIDVTAKLQSESHLVNLALSDPLTGLANRAQFEKTLVAAVAQPACNLAILMIDLDRFKGVNDTLGHPTGDGLLRLVAQRLQSAVAGKGVAARLGGDEFAVIISPGISPGELAGLADQIIDLLRRTFLVNGHAINIGASIGIAVFPNDGDSMELLMKGADLALYHSKALGKGRFHFFERAMEERAQARRNLELELRKALPTRQLQVFYQPQVDTLTKQMLGLEAEIRWQHPKRGLMEPKDFAPLAEELGLSVQIADWMLRAACRYAAKWPDHLRLSFSASCSHFENNRLLESVIRALEASGLPAHRLEIQVTEVVLLQNETGVFAALHDLRALGVRVVMDEFGTGYASLSQLANFPFDRVNINRKLFVEGSGNAKHRAIVKGIAALGASLGISTVGQGIESQAELSRIHGDGCTAVQGYLPTTGIPESTLQEILSGMSAAHNTQLSPFLKEEIHHEQSDLQSRVLQS